MCESIAMLNTPRLKKELSQLIDKPPIGIKVNIEENATYALQAELNGPKDSPYEDGIFQLQIEVPQMYPFEPPRVIFLTPIYHPNIYRRQIRLDILKRGPASAWEPKLTIESVLVAVCNLLNCPNPNDPLVPEIANELKTDKDIFEDKAKKFTKMHATIHRTTT